MAQGGAFAVWIITENWCSMFHINILIFPRLSFNAFLSISCSHHSFSFSYILNKLTREVFIHAFAYILLKFVSCFRFCFSFQIKIRFFQFFCLIFKYLNFVRFSNLQSHLYKMFWKTIECETNFFANLTANQYIYRSKITWPNIFHKVSGKHFVNFLRFRIFLKKPCFFMFCVIKFCLHKVANFTIICCFAVAIVSSTVFVT